jgi:hypothetical protein
MRPVIPLLLLLAACDVDAPSAPLPPAELAIIAGGGMDTLPRDRVLLDELVVQVTDGDGRGVAGIEVAFGQDAPAGEILPATAVTDADGMARAIWRLGGIPGEWTAEARAGSLGRVAVTARVRGTRVAMVKGDGSRRCRIAMDGGLACWLDWIPEARPVPTAPGQRFVDLTVDNARGLGVGPACALTDAGRLWCATTPRNDWPTGAEESPQPVAFAPVDVAHPPLQQFGVLRDATFCGLDGTGVVWCWGENNSGARGDGTTDPASTATPTRLAVPEQVRFTELATGPLMACALDTEGFPWCWGFNVNGAVAPGLPNGAYSSPHRVSVPEPLRSLRMTRWEGVCGLTTQGLPICWGDPITRGQAQYNVEGSGFTPRRTQRGGPFATFAPTDFGFVGVDGGRLHSWGSDDPFHGSLVLVPSEVPALSGLRVARIHDRNIYDEALCVVLALGGETVCINPRVVYGRAGVWTGEQTLRTYALQGIAE